jgi:hypothetical protein
MESLRPEEYRPDMRVSEGASLFDRGMDNGPWSKK